MLDFLNQINSSQATPDELILYYKKFREALPYNKAISFADCEIIKVKKDKKEYANEIENLIFNTNIGNHSICFITFYEELKFKNNLVEFGVFSECEPLYFDAKSLNILVQRPGYYYFEYPDEIVIAFKNVEVFFEALKFLNKILNDKMYRSYVISDELFVKLIEINLGESNEFLKYIFEMVRNFE